MKPGDFEGFVERLAWLATHGWDIYQFMGEEHRDDAKRFNEPKRPPRAAPAKPRAKRKSRGTIKYTGPGFTDKAK